MDNYMAAISNQDRHLSERDDTSINIDIIHLGNTDELAHLFQDADMGLESERMEAHFLPVRTMITGQ
jgi:hypothetical protein